MKIRFMSDLHLEFDGPFTVPVHEDDSSTILVLAGDIGVAGKKNTYANFIELMSSRFRKVIYIPGNHEYYRTSIIRGLDKIKDNVNHLSNVHAINNETVIVDDVAFICSTMWASMDNGNPLVLFDVREKMNDFKMIRTGPVGVPYQRKLRPIDVMGMFQAAKEFIFNEINRLKDTHKLVVVTHHGPSFESVPDKFKGDIRNGAYVSELGYDIADANAPDIWIHGHVHDNTDYTIGKTRVLVNPRGYYPKYLNPDFDPHSHVEV